MEQNKVYIAGKIKGLKQSDVESKFAAAEKFLTGKGFDVCNPFEYMKNANKGRQVIGLAALSDDNAADRNIIMRVCVMQLATCDFIYLLHDWQDSKGATIEKDIADKLGIKQLSYSSDERNQ